MKYLFAMLVLSAMILTSLPLAVSANSVETLVKPVVQESMGPFVGAGNDSYYRDNRVIFKGQIVPITKVGIRVGGDPEIPGGDQSAPASDEIDTPLTVPIIVVTRARSGKFLLGTVDPVINGVQIIVRRIKATGQIIEILNCGNWTRQLDSDWTFSCPETNGLCRPGKEESSTSEDVSPDGLTRTVITITSDGCKTKIEKTITSTVEKTVNVCTPGAWLDVMEQGSFNGKLGKTFKVSEVITQLPAELQARIVAAVGRDKINYLLVQQGACESERNLIKVRWFTKSGGWSWVSFLVGVGVGIGIGYFIHSTPNNPQLTPIKSQSLPPVRGGITGSGSTSGGVIGTRPMRP